MTTSQEPTNPLSSDDSGVIEPEYKGKIYIYGVDWDIFHVDMRQMPEKILPFVNINKINECFHRLTQTTIEINVALDGLNDVLKKLEFADLLKGKRRRAAQRMIRDAKWERYIRKIQGEQ